MSYLSKSSSGNILTGGGGRPEVSYTCSIFESLLVSSQGDTVNNVCHRLATCDHLLDLKSWKKGDPPPRSGNIIHHDHQTSANSPSATGGGDGKISQIQGKQSTTPVLSTHTSLLIIDLFHEPSEAALMEELDSIKEILDPKTPNS